MQIHRNVGLNFIGGAWLGVLIVLTTPWYIADLGLEGFGLVGIWQLFFYIALIFDLGLGAACVRELSRFKGLNRAGTHSRALLSLFEKPVLGIAVLLCLMLALAAPWIAGSWLNLRAYGAADVTTILRLMALSIALQFISAFYLNALGGLQRMDWMNGIQIFNNTLKYLGGAVVLWLTDGIVGFFAFQAVAGLIGALIARWVALSVVSPRGQDEGPAAAEDRSLRRFMRFSGGMFLTAACGALLSNADRLAVSRLMDGEALGKYTVALTIIGLLQTLVFAFHRAYYPRFSELSAAGDPARLRGVYYAACTQVGAVIVPCGLLFACFTPELFFVWLGWSAVDTVSVSRLLVFGFVLSAVMWLPAAYQQAIGWTRLHATLMALTLLFGVPMLVLGIRHFGLLGAATLIVTHGLIQVTAGLWIMNRVCFPGENWLWYQRVLGAPLLLGGPLVGMSKLLMPPDLGRLGAAAWIAATGLLVAGALVAWMRCRQRALA